MQKGILDLYFDVGFSIPITLVLEPSEERWQSIYQIADGLIQSLPGRLSSIYFLGNTQDYSVLLPQDFRQHSPNWFAKNKDRVSLIGPVFGRLEEEGFRGMVVVVCSMLPVDVDDWLGTEIIERTLFVRKGDEPLSDDYSEVDGTLGIDCIMRALDNPVKEVSVKGEGFVPLCWEVEPKGEAKVVWKDEGFELQIFHSQERLKLHLKALCQEQPPSLYVKRLKGEAEIVNGKEEFPWFTEPSWQELPESLKPVIEAGVSKNEFLCPWCGHSHQYDTLLCPEGDLILKGMPTNTCLLFKSEIQNLLYLSISGWYAYPVKDNQRIITREGNLHTYEESGWKFLRRVEPYEEVDNGVWALFHRI